MNQKNSTRPPTAHIAPFGVRMQPELKQRLEEAAKESGRSMNAEIVARLEGSLDPSKQDADIDMLMKSITELRREVKRLAVIKSRVTIAAEKPSDSNGKEST